MLLINKICFVLSLSLIFCSAIKAQQIEVKGQVDADYLMEIVTELASKEYAGRLPGSDGFNLAATYVANKFKKYKIKSVERDSFFQYFNVEHNHIKSPLKLEFVDKKDKRKPYKPGSDFVCRGFTGQGVYTADVVFCGYGISLPKHKYDDYAGVDVKGKVVMIFKENPSWKHIIDWPTIYPRYKAMIAASYGAVGVLLVSAPANSRNTKPIGSIATGPIAQHNNETTSMHISPEVAADLLKPSKYTLKELQSIIDTTKKPFSLDLGTKVYTEVHTEYTNQKPTMNIIGVIQGNDPILKEEYLLIGAHLDHVGSQGDELYFPGANDNASGVAAVLQMAKLFSENKEHLKRSVVFILFSNEEQGLYGSWHYVKNPLFPLEKTVAMLNLDCIAHGDSIQIGNGKSAPVLWQLAKDIDKRQQNLTVERTWSGGGADATPFFDMNIPALYFVTTNSYTHLHLPTDKPETLNKNLFKNITQLAYETAWQIATGNYQKEKNIR